MRGVLSLGLKMSAEYKIKSDGTILRFCVTNKGYNDCGYFWTDDTLSVTTNA